MNQKESTIKVEKIENRILKYHLYDDRTGCQIFYTLDLDTFELFISGETSGSYKWVNTEPRETFVSLLKRCNKFYICEKLFNKIWSNEKAIEAALEDFNQFKDDFEDSKTIIQDIKSIESDGYDSFRFYLEDIIDSNRNYYEPDFEDIFSDFYDHSFTEYRYWDEKSVELFINFVVPILEEWRN